MYERYCNSISIRGKGAPFLTINESLDPVDDKPMDAAGSSDNSKSTDKDAESTTEDEDLEDKESDPAVESAEYVKTSPDEPNANGPAEVTLSKAGVSDGEQEATPSHITASIDHPACVVS